MKNKAGKTLSRREFAQHAAVLSATASLVPAEVILPHSEASACAQTTQSAPQLTEAGQAEAESRYQQILSLYSGRLDDVQKTDIKRMCIELQPSLERIRSFRLQNGDAPALYLKPLVEREKKPLANSTAKPAANPKQP